MKKKKKFNQGLEKPSIEFTNNVMHQVNAEEEALKSLLSKNGLEGPSLAFASNIMKAVEAAPKETYTPVISKKVWIFIGLIITAFFTLSFWGLPQSTDETYGLEAIQAFKSLIEQFALFSSFRYAIISIFGISILLMADQLLGMSQITDRSSLG